METPWAYMAGLFDGEGSFSAQVDARQWKDRWNIRINPRMSMGLLYGNEVLSLFSENIGGAIYERTKAKYEPDNRTRQWVCSKREPLLVGARELLPYLRIKRGIAERFLELLEIIPATRAGHGFGERSWTPEMVEQAARLAFSLNPQTGRWPRRGEDEISRLVALIS